MIDISIDMVESIIYSLPIDIKTKRDNEIIFFCPFHNDKKNPNYSFNIEKQLGSCWSCGSKHNLYSIVKELTGKNIYKEYNISKQDTSFSKILNNNEKSSKIIREYLNEKEINKVNFDLNLKTKHPFEDEISKKYCIQRGITEEIIDKYSIEFVEYGYINNTEYINRLLIPIKNKFGDIASYEGRDVTRKQEKKCIYPKGSKNSQCIFDIENLITNEPVVIVEGIMDIWRVKEALPNIQVTTFFGIQLSKKQVKIIQNFEDIILLLDGDEAGKRGIDIFLNTFFPNEIKNDNLFDFNDKSKMIKKVRIAELPDNLDPGDSSIKQIKTAIHNAIDRVEYLIRDANICQNKIFKNPC